MLTSAKYRRSIHLDIHLVHYPSFHMRGQRRYGIKWFKSCGLYKKHGIFADFAEKC